MKNKETLKAKLFVYAIIIIFLVVNWIVYAG